MGELVEPERKIPQTVDKKTPQVRTEMELLGRKIENCIKQISELEDKLVDVLTPMPEDVPDEEKTALEPSQQVVPLVKKLRNYWGNLHNLENRIRKINERLEI